MSQLISMELDESAQAITSIDVEQLLSIARTLVKTFRAGRKLVLFGNGGSAADAQHIAAEFSGRYAMERRALDAAAFTNLSAATAIGNDYSYEKVFERQVESCVRQGDAVMAISTSGNSKNVLLAVERARSLGAVTIGLTGKAGKLKDVVDFPLMIPSSRTPRIQEGYMAAAHIICGLVEKGVFGKPAVFVDRDDTLAKDVPYCSRPEELKLMKGAGRAIKRLNEAGYLVIVITNQSGIGRGFFDEPTLERIHDKLRSELAKDGARLDAIYYCPHRPESGCKCRKPDLGLIEQAMEEFDIDILGSYVIGDSDDHDMELARRIGCPGVKVGKGFGLADAVDGILKRK
jgi:D-sedoheptulose 7-phosphate isomerase